MVVRSGPYQLLIADDDAAFRETLQSVFEPYFDLIVVESAEEAVAVVEYRPVHVALLDMHMHGMTGLEAIRMMKRMNAEAPCILITSDASEQLCADATAADAFSVLKKPVTRRKLVTTVSSAIEDAYEDSDVMRAAR